MPFCMQFGAPRSHTKVGRSHLIVNACRSSVRELVAKVGLAELAMTAGSNDDIVFPLYFLLIPQVSAFLTRL